MSIRVQWIAKLSALFGARRADDEMTREMRAHLDLIADDLERQGMPPEAARAAARRAFGGLEQVREQHRDARSVVWIEQLLQDLRHAIRGLRKSPGFSIAALLSIVLGVGVNSAIFTFVHGILLEELAVDDPDRVVQVRAQMKDFESAGFSYPAFRGLAEQTGVFADLIAFSSRPARLETGLESRRIEMQMVTGAFFSFFNQAPHLGRLLDRDDDRVEGAHAVCVLGYRAWRRHFASDPSIVGRTIQVDGRALEIVGVAGPDFIGPEIQRRFDLWVPSALVRDFTRNPRETPNYVWLRLLGRLAPAVSMPEAASRLEAASAGIEASLPESRANRDAVYRVREGGRGFDSSWRTELGRPLLILMGAAFMVLLIACANLANLLLARGSQRTQEFAIKLSIGVQRTRLARQVLLESTLLAVAGALGGVVVARAITGMMLDLYNAGDAHQTLQVDLDPAVLWFTATACLLTALIAGGYPAWRASRVDPVGGLRPRTVAGGQRATVRRGLIVAQVTLAVVLVFGANLFARSLWNLKHADLGFDIRGVMTVQVERRSITAVAPATAPPDLRALLDRVRARPEVESASLSTPGVLTGGSMTLDVEAGEAGGQRRKIDNVHVVFATPGYLSTLRLPLRRGRDLVDTDRAGALPVALVNEELARQVWPGQDPIGKHFRGWGADVEVVGVVGNSNYQSIRGRRRAIAIQAFDQMPVTGATLHLRCRTGCTLTQQEARGLAQSAGPELQVNNVASLEVLRDNLIARDRLFAFLSSLFGALGATLALVGIYGLIAYSVRSRTREIGIRVSVGAGRGSVVWLFVREAAILLTAAVALGIPLALALAGYVRTLLYAVPTTDPATVAITAVVILAGGLTATLLPARRATRVNPVEALRYD
jgi:putative ABC transport system permease protein